MSAITGFLFSISGFLSIDAVIYAAAAAQTVCFIRNLVMLRKWSQKGFAKKRNPYIIYTVICFAAFLLSFFPAEKIYQPAAVFIILLFTQGIFVFIEKLLTENCENKTENFAFDSLSETGTGSGCAESYANDSDTAFEEFYAMLRAKAENADMRELEKLALVVSEEREKPSYGTKQKEKLNGLLNTIIKSIAEK